MPKHTGEAMDTSTDINDKYLPSSNTMWGHWIEREKGEGNTKVSVSKVEGRNTKIHFTLTHTGHRTLGGFLSSSPLLTSDGNMIRTVID